MSLKVEVEGLRELDAALAQFPKATAKNILKRVLVNAAAGMVSAAQANAPVDTGRLQQSIHVGTKLTRRQASKAKKDRGFQRVKTDKGYRTVTDGAVEVYVGPYAHPKSITQEFGTVDHGPQPYMRPAFDSEVRGTLEHIKRELGDQIQKAAARAARKKLKG